MYPLQCCHRYSEAQPARADADADATLTAGPHGLVKHRGRGRDLAALQSQVIAKLGRQVDFVPHVVPCQHPAVKSFVLVMHIPSPPPPSQLIV